MPRYYLKKGLTSSEFYDRYYRSGHNISKTICQPLFQTISDHISTKKSSKISPLGEYHD